MRPIIVAEFQEYVEPPQLTAKRNIIQAGANNAKPPISISRRSGMMFCEIGFLAVCSGILKKRRSRIVSPTGGRLM